MWSGDVLLNDRSPTANQTKNGVVKAIPAVGNKRDERRPFTGTSLVIPHPSPFNEHNRPTAAACPTGSRISMALVKDRTELILCGPKRLHLPLSCSFPAPGDADEREEPSNLRVARWPRGRLSDT
jgi:hypothetical protein